MSFGRRGRLGARAVFASLLSASCAVAAGCNLILGIEGPEPTGAGGAGTGTTASSTDSATSTNAASTSTGMATGCGFGEAPTPNTACVGVFLAAGPTNGDGSRGAPVNTIDFAIARLKALDAMGALAQGGHLYICGSDAFTTTNTIDLPANVSVWGGLECGTWTWGPETGGPTPTLHGPAVALQTNGGDVTISHVAVTNDVGDVPAADGQTSIAVLALGTDLVLDHAQLTARAGHDGPAGAAPTSLGPAISGTTPGTACGNQVLGATSSCGATGGNGGNANMAPNGTAGLPAPVGGAGGTMITCAGGAGLNGSAGTVATGPIAPAQVGAAGYVPPDMPDGGAGSPGGGGGGGYSVQNVCPPNNNKAQVGSSGAAGGCGGAGGHVGGAGGSSFALVLAGTSTVEITASALVVGAAGSGGAGAAGQAGQVGGAASMGINGGCAGGKGGDGGAGAPGPGGPAGISAVIVAASTSPAPVFDASSTSTSAAQGMPGSGSPTGVSAPAALPGSCALLDDANYALRICW